MRKSVTLILVVLLGLIILVGYKMRQSNTTKSSIQTKDSETVAIKESKSKIDSEKKSTAALTNNSTKNNDKFEYILDIIDLSKNEVISKLGKNYQIVETGAEGSYDGYYYKDLGLTFTFEYEAESKVEKIIWINVDKEYSVKGTHDGMNFKQIQNLLGKSEIKDTWVETPENKAYEIDYTFENVEIQFLAYDRDGNDSMMTIYRK